MSQREIEAGDRRGEKLAKPRAIGWKTFFIHLYREITDGRLLSVAAGVTFYAILALFPAIAAFISIYGLMADPATIQQHMSLLDSILPGGAIDIVSAQAQSLIAKGDRTLGASFIVGLLIALWSANAGMKALFDALNIVHEEKEKRSFLMLNAISLLFTVGSLLFAVIALAGVVAIPVALKTTALGSQAGSLMPLARWPIMLLVFAVAISLVYRYGPSRLTTKWRWITWGAGLASIATLGASAVFSWYVANFGSYDETYGSLGAVVGFMTWIWLSTTIVLVCAEVNAEIEREETGSDDAPSA